MSGHRTGAAAYRANGQAVTPSQFYALACDPRASAVVEACAGAGKTWMLVSRILRALLDGARPQDILAITFTRKAAGEMRERLQLWLREFALATPTERIDALMQRGMSQAEATSAEPRLADLYEHLLSHGRGVEIRTFHAWFSQLMRHAPMALLDELGLQPELALVDDPQELIEEAWRPFLRAIAGEPELRADFTALVQARSRTTVQRWLEAGLQRRVEFAMADEAGVLENSVPAASELWAYWDLSQGVGSVLASATVRQTLDAAARVLGAAGNVTARKAADGLVDALLLLERGEAGAFERARDALFTKTGALRSKLPPGDELNEAVRVLEGLIEAQSQQAAHEEHLRLVRLTRVMHRVYAQNKRARGLADMGDLERCALHLLRDAELSAWAQERLDARVRHLLIDEFQDTSPLQWHALQGWLAAYAGAGGGRDAPRVFIVGDPKQSIYRFRGAEPRVFAAAQEFVQEALGGHLLACDHTRRNAPAVIDAVNAVFGRAVDLAGYEGYRAHTTGSDDEGEVLAFDAVPRPEKSKREPSGGASCATP